MSSHKVHISFTAYCQCCYNTGLDVPEELLEEGKEHDLTEYVNSHINICSPVDGYQFIEDLPIEEDDLISSYDICDCYSEDYDKFCEGIMSN